MSFAHKANQNLPANRNSILQRKCADCEKEKRESRGPLRRQAAHNDEIGEVPPIVHDVLGSTGRPLSPDVRAEMEQHFSYDFSRVRVHTDARATESAQSINALAYTVGSNIVFGEGQFSTDTTQGNRLLAHELTHVVQQDGRQESGPLTVAPSNDSYERQADEVAQQVVANDPGSKNISTRGNSIQRALSEPVEFGNAAETIVEEEEVLDGDSPAGSGLVPVGEVALAEEAAADNEQELTATPSFDETSAERGGLIQTKPQPGAKNRKKSPVPKKRRGRWIKRIKVDLSEQRLTIFWSKGKPTTRVRISSGKGRPNTKGDPCKSTKNLNCTETGTFTPQRLGGKNYRNHDNARMDWFTEYDTIRHIGIHGGQEVTGQPASHGCVRVHDYYAELIHDHVTTQTKIEVSGKAPTKPWRESPIKKRRSSSRGRIRRKAASSLAVPGRTMLVQRQQAEKVPLRPRAPKQQCRPTHVAGKISPDEPYKIVRIAWTLDDGPTSFSDEMRSELGTRRGTWYIHRNRLPESGKELQEKLASLVALQKQGQEFAIHSIHPTINHAAWFPISKSRKSVPRAYDTMSAAMSDLVKFVGLLRNAGLRIRFVRLPGGLISELEYYLTDELSKTKKRLDQRLKSTTDAKQREAIANDLKILRGANNNALAKQIIKGQDTSKYQHTSPVTLDYALLNHTLANLGLHRWGDPGQLQSWEAESTPFDPKRDTITPKFEGVVEEFSTVKRPRFFVVLSHDTKPQYAAEVGKDIKTMEALAEKEGVRLEYYTMSGLYECLKGKKP